MPKENPTIQEIGSTLYISWKEGLGIKVERLKESRGEPQAEITFRLLDGFAHFEAGHLLGPERLVLTSRSGKDTLLRTLNKQFDSPPVDWWQAIEHLTYTTIDFMRQTTATELIGHKRKFKDENTGFWLSPVLRRNQPCVLYGEGGTGKSLLGIYFSLLIKAGLQQNGLQGTPANVLYLDWETDPFDFEQRVFAIAAGFPDLEGHEIAYRRCTQPFLAELENISRQVSELKTDVLVIDSFEASLSANSNDGEVIQPVFNALRDLNVTPLLIDHKSKEDSSRTKSSGPIGSVMKLNRARTVIEVAASEGDTIGLFCRKTNTGRRFKPLGLSLAFEGEDTLNKLTFTRTQISDTDLDQKLSLFERVEAKLRHGGKTKDALADELGADKQQISNALHRHPKIFQEVGKTTDQSGRRKTLWGLKAYAHAEN